MYLREVTIRNIRSIRKFHLELSLAECPGWHVLLGDNGSGKSTIIRSMALGLTGPTEAAALRQNWRDWLRTDEDEGSIELSIDHAPAYDKVTGQGRPVGLWLVPAALNLTRSESGLVTLQESKRDPDPKRYIWGEGEGWFSASYGPFRRFTGGNKEFEKLYYSNPRLAPI